MENEIKPLLEVFKPLQFIDYQSPITMEIDKITTEINQQTEEYILNAVMACNIKVDKNELIKALSYDRIQYKKGFQEGCDDATELIEDIIMFADNKFYSYAYKEDYELHGYELYDLVNKYGLRDVMNKWVDWKRVNENDN